MPIHVILNIFSCSGMNINDATPLSVSEEVSGTCAVAYQVSALPGAKNNNTRTHMYTHVTIDRVTLTTLN